MNSVWGHRPEKRQKKVCYLSWDHKVKKGRPTLNLRGPLKASSNPMKKRRLGAGAFQWGARIASGREGSRQLTGYLWADACVQSAVYTCVSLWNLRHVAFCIVLQSHTIRIPPLYILFTKRTWPQNTLCKNIMGAEASGEIVCEDKGKESEVI